MGASAAACPFASRLKRLDLDVKPHASATSAAAPQISKKFLKKKSKVIIFIIKFNYNKNTNCVRQYLKLSKVQNFFFFFNT